MAIGTVKWFSPVKGYGFIQPEEGNTDVFVHISALEKAGIRQIKEGQKVNYETEMNRGKTAVCTISLVE